MHSSHSVIRILSPIHQLAFQATRPDFYKEKRTMQPVSPTTTTHKTNADYARERRDRRERYRQERRCVDCGATPLALKLDQTPSLRCEKHLDRTRYINEKR